MATMKMPMAVGTGSGGAKSDTLNFGGTSVTKEIDTGLGSALSKFVMIGAPNPSDGYPFEQVVAWTSDYPSYYWVAYGNGHSNAKQSVGSAYANYACKIDSVSNGKVTITSASDNTFNTATCDCYWYAE